MLRKSIKWFAEFMETQMKSTDRWHKPWENGGTPVLFYLTRLKAETENLNCEILDYHLNPTETGAAEVQIKAADVANLAHIIAAMHSIEMGKLNRGKEAP